LFHNAVAKCREELVLSEERRNRIRTWIAMNDGPTVLSEPEANQLASAFDCINAVLTELIKELRRYRNADSRGTL